MQQSIADCRNAKKKNLNNSKKYFDFEKDFNLLYAAFFETYKIDLKDGIKTLSVKQFEALFQGLPNQTKLMQIIELRQMDRSKIKDSKLAKLFDEVNLNNTEDFISNSITSFSQSFKK